MKEYNLFGYQVEIDEAATKEWFDKADEWGCECGDCRHFVELAKKREIPSAVIEILEQFGIAPEKATYVCEIVKHTVVMSHILMVRRDFLHRILIWSFGYDCQRLTSILKYRE